MVPPCSSKHGIDSSLDSRVVLLSERDRLALEWELHHVRWLLMSSQGVARSAANSTRMPPLQPGQRVAHYETDPDEHNAHMDRRWDLVLKFLDDLLHEHDQERLWWAENKETAPLNVLKQAVRKMMAAGGGAQGPEEEIGGDDIEAVEGPKEVRPLRWLLAVRAEIARRRILTGEIHFLVKQGQDPDKGVAWTEERMEELSHRIHEASFADEGAADLNTRELLELVVRREDAAASLGVTGDHRAPALLNLDAIGAATHEEEVLSGMSSALVTTGH